MYLLLYVMKHSQLNPKKSKDKTKYKDSKDKHVETVETDKCLTLTDLKADEAVSNTVQQTIE